MRNQFSVVILFLLILGCKPQTSYQDMVIQYFEINGTEDQYSEAVDKMFELLKNQYGAQQVPEKVWVELANNKAAALDDIKSLLVPVYQTNFEQEDIEVLLSFYESETGKQVVKDQSSLNEKQKEEFANFLVSKAGKKVQDKSEALQQMVSEVSESWSSALYATMIQKLSEKGFTR